jgi:peptidylprolyl isomerase domain and WD repeat-containing protein 1
MKRSGQNEGEGGKNEEELEKRISETEIKKEDEEEGRNDVEIIKPDYKKRLKYEKLYLDHLPCAAMYEKSYMHRKTVTHVVTTNSSEFILTGSEDGHLKFWKKLPKGIEFVKHFISHTGPITSVAVSYDGAFAATASKDKTVKIYDVINFGRYDYHY